MKNISCFIIFILCTYCQAQTQFIFVYFKDKPNKAIFYADPTTELSQKSLQRRKSLGIALNDQDAPVESTYLQKLSALGLSVTDFSKWLNGAAVEATDAQIALIKTQPYVREVKSFVKTSGSTNKLLKTSKWATEAASFSPNSSYVHGSAGPQLEQVKIKQLHDEGFTGKNIAIAVLDTGFPTVDTGLAYAKLRKEGRIKAGYNFITKNADIYNTSLNAHGANCLGILGGYLEGTFVGSAPDADYYLYATESGPQEIPQEEMYWIEAAEEADRKGVDIISSSLGYGNFFDDPIYNYTYADMNGSTSFIAKGAQTAAEKGIFVVVANGNEAQTSWHYLLTPADNALVLSIGAVDANGNSSTFSSYGPNSVGVVKPDGSARGTATAYVFNNAAYSGNGTSYATPIAAGGVACLLQALPPYIPREIIRAKLHETASLYPNTTPQQGYGIFNFYETYSNISKQLSESPVNIYPNPIQDNFKIYSYEKLLSVELYDASGRKIANLKPERDNSLAGFNKGLYLLKIVTDKKNYIKKIIKK